MIFVNPQLKKIIGINVALVIMFIGISFILTTYFDWYIAIPIMIGIVIAIKLITIKMFIKSVREQPTKVSYVCIGCGNPHNFISCPKCGTKGRRTSFE